MSQILQINYENMLASFDMTNGMDVELFKGLMRSYSDYGYILRLVISSKKTNLSVVRGFPTSKSLDNLFGIFIQ